MDSKVFRKWELKVVDEILSLTRVQKKQTITNIAKRIGNHLTEGWAGRGETQQAHDRDMQEILIEVKAQLERSK